MKQNRTHRLGDLQLRIMKVLWTRSEANVSEVLAALEPTSELAYTTIATMLRKMEARGLLAHRVEGRSFVYRAAVGEAEVSRSMADHLVDRLFEGSLIEAVSHLLTTRQISRAELNQLEKLIAERKQKL
jgi:BlaI family penicillinase repressor